MPLSPSHISAYCLTYEEDTEYFARLSRSEYVPDKSLEADLFETTMDMLEGSGFSQYEISNYARPNRECRHNLAYWLGENFLGLGPSAFSTVGDNRWKNVSDTAKYITAVEREPRAYRFPRDAFRKRAPSQNTSPFLYARTTGSLRSLLRRLKPRNSPRSAYWFQGQPVDSYTQGTAPGRFHC